MPSRAPVTPRMPHGQFFGWHCDAHVIVLFFNSFPLKFSNVVSVNTVLRGLGFANWRKVFHAIIIPSSPTARPFGTLASPNHLSSKPCRWHRMTPSEKSAAVSAPPPLHLSTTFSISFISLTLKRQSVSFSRLARIPLSTVLRTIAQHNPAASWTIPCPIPTTLRSLIPDSFPLYIAPHIYTWSHPRLTDNLNDSNTTTVGTYVRTISLKPQGNALSLYIYPLPHPDRLTA